MGAPIAILCTLLGKSHQRHVLMLISDKGVLVSFFHSFSCQ